MRKASSVAKPVVGVDASSSRLVAVALVGTELRVSTRKLSSDVTTSCQEAYGWMHTVLSEYTPVLVAVEAPFVHRLHPTGSVGLAQVNGALLAALGGYSSISVSPTHWKKTVVGSGKVDKQGIEYWVRAQHPEVVDDLVIGDRLDQDRLDAFCIALHAVHVLEIRDRLLVTR